MFVAAIVANGEGIVGEGARLVDFCTESGGVTTLHCWNPLFASICEHERMYGISY